MRGVLWVSAGGHRDPPLRFWGGDKFSGNDEMRGGNDEMRGGNDDGNVPVIDHCLIRSISSHIHSR